MEQKTEADQGLLVLWDWKQVESKYGGRLVTPKQIIISALTDLKVRYGGLIATDRAAYKAVSAAYSDIRRYRLDVGKRFDNEKKRMNDRKKELVAAAEWLIGELTPLESELKGEKNAWEAAREAEKQAAEKAEADRKSGILDKIQAIRDAGQGAERANSDDLQELIFEIEEIKIDQAGFQEFFREANTAKRAVLEKLDLLVERRLLEEEKAAFKAEKIKIEAAKRAAAPQESHQVRGSEDEVVRGEMLPPKVTKKVEQDDFFSETPAGNFLNPEDIAAKLAATRNPERILTDREKFEELSDALLLLVKNIEPEGEAGHVILQRVRGMVTDIADYITKNLEEI